MNYLSRNFMFCKYNTGVVNKHLKCDQIPQNLYKIRLYV